MKFLFLLLFFVFHTCLLYSQKITQGDDSISYRIVLIGDGGELTNGHHPVAEAVKKIIPMDEKTTIIYLGDNLYKHGLPDDQTLGYAEAKAVLDSQLSIADHTPAKIYMIPGNHDWNNGARNGYDAILREQRYVSLLGKPNVRFYPEDGCPGPVEVSLGADVTVVFFDSQWWLHRYDKPGIESDCDYKTTEEVIAQMDDIFGRNSKKLVILACHHTFKSISPHAGYFTFRQYLFPFTDMNPNLYIPLPVIGAIYPISRGIFGTPQDLHHPIYQNMISDVQRIAKPYKNIIYAAGHEHSLQLIHDSAAYYIVSGSGSKTTRVSGGKKSLFHAQMTGFSVLEVSKNKNVRVSFYTVTDSIRKAYSNVIMNFTTVEQPTSDSLNRVVENPKAIRFQDTITISASDKYNTKSPLKKFVMGTNYRQEWSTPVNMKVLHLNTEKGGLKIKSLGGGKQTKSLQLLDSKGKEWVLRTVDKDPTRAIPLNFQATVFKNIVRDFISASHPYGAMAVPTLSEPLGLTVAKPELFFVPEDPAFQKYKDIFKNTICLLEERFPTKRGEETSSTAKVFEKLIEENDHRADQLAALRARMLDILIADFDRHFDQYRWATTDTGKGKLYYPIPKDRDQAFFYSNGFLMRIISLKVLPFLKGFRYHIPDVNGLMEVGKDFDRVFLTDLGKKEWETTVKEVKDKLNDSVFSAAMKKLPPEISAIDSATIIAKLKSRRGLLDNAAMRYYHFLSRTVNVVGSNQKEYFKITGAPKGGINVRVYGRSDKDTDFVMYDRTFDHHDTKEIRLYGLNGDDLFDMSDTVSSRIRIRFVGGRGNDTFDIRGHARSYLYDMKVEGNHIKTRHHVKSYFSSDPTVNSSNILGFKYNEFNIPLATVAANNDDGLLIGTGFSTRTYGFRNEPFKSYQRGTALWAANRGGEQFKYSGIFNHVFRSIDMNLSAELMTPGVNNFFGLGNKTVRDPDKSPSFYRVRYRHASAEILFQKRYFEPVKVMIGPTFYAYWIRHSENEDKVLGKPKQNLNLDSLSVYSEKRYAGGKFVVNIDNLNNDLFPTRGVLWNTEFSSQIGINKNSNNLTKLQSDMTVYASLNDPTRLIAVIRLGAGHIFNKNFEYFQAMTLGANNYLRGFRKNRFAGGSIAYGGLELRLKLADVKSYLLPGTFGIIGFNETGRVWMKNETSHLWHYAYGGGLFYIPFNLFIVSGTIGFSKDDHIFNFSIGTKLNLNF